MGLWSICNYVIDLVYTCVLYYIHAIGWMALRVTNVRMSSFVDKIFSLPIMCVTVHHTHACAHTHTHTPHAHSFFKITFSLPVTST